MDFKKNIKEILNILDLNYTALAALLGVTKLELLEITNGIKNPTPEFLLGLTKLGVSIDWFLTGTGAALIDSREQNYDLIENVPLRSAISRTYDKKATDSYYLNNYDKSIKSNDTQKNNRKNREFTVFKFKNERPLTFETHKDDPHAITLLPLFSQWLPIEFGNMQIDNAQIESYVPIRCDILGTSHPKDCGIIKITENSTPDISLTSGDLVIFDKAKKNGDGIYVICIGDNIKIKKMEYRIFEHKILIVSENGKYYRNPEAVSYGQEEENIFHILGKVICYIHKNSY